MKVSKRAKCVAAIELRTENEAAEVMWLYYRDNKAQLVSYIKEYRAQILTELMAGVPVETVFAPYFKPVDQVKQVRRAA
jgi:hypothetical protein